MKRVPNEEKKTYQAFVAGAIAGDDSMLFRVIVEVTHLSRVEFGADDVVIVAAVVTSDQLFEYFHLLHDEVIHFAERLSKASFASLVRNRTVQHAAAVVVVGGEHIADLVQWTLAHIHGREAERFLVDCFFVVKDVGVVGDVLTNIFDVFIVQ